MGLKIRVLSGPLSGQEFKLQAGLKFGRTKGEVRLDDTKVSSLHAFIATGDNGELLLQDNGSKNGLRFEGTRVPYIVLGPEIRFFIGNTEFEVLEESVAPPALPEAPPPPPEPQTVVAPSIAKAPEAAARPGARRWNEILADVAERASLRIEETLTLIEPLLAPVNLTFIGGVQAETRWTLGYGPRRVGAISVDLPIFEPNAPDICFEILPDPEGVTFRTNHPKEVRVNGQSLTKKLLVRGDLITVGETRIEVEL